MNFGKNTRICMYLGKRYTIQELKRVRLGATTVDGMQPGRGGGQGTGVGVICGYTNVWCRLKNNMYVASKI